MSMQPDQQRSARQSAAALVPRMRAKAKGEPVSPPTYVPHVEAAPDGAKPLLRLEPHDCRWPVGKGPPWRFCAKQQIPGRSYCAEHQARAYKPRDASC